MTAEDIIRTARNEYGIYAFTAEDLAAFIITVKNAEREECAKFLEETHWYPENNDAKVLAEKLRARGQHD